MQNGSPVPLPAGPRHEETCFEAGAARGAEIPVPDWTAMPPVPDWLALLQFQPRHTTRYCLVPNKFESTLTKSQTMM